MGLADVFKKPLSVFDEKVPVKTRYKALSAYLEGLTEEETKLIFNEFQLKICSLLAEAGSYYCQRLIGLCFLSFVLAKC